MGWTTFCRRTLLILTASATILTAEELPQEAPAQKMPKKPNFIMIMTDDVAGAT